MAPSPTPPEPPGALDRPVLLNEKFKVHSYDGGSFKSRAQYDVKNALIPIIEPFHCSGSGTKFTLVLKCSEDFTLSHFYLSGPGPRCTEPIRSGLVWVVDQPPENECLKKYDAMSSEELMEIMKGLRTYSSCDEAGGLPDPCVYFTGSKQQSSRSKRLRQDRKPLERKTLRMAYLESGIWGAAQSSISLASTLPCRCDSLQSVVCVVADSPVDSSSGASTAANPDHNSFSSPEHCPEVAISFGASPASDSSSPAVGPAQSFSFQHAFTQDNPGRIEHFYRVGRRLGKGAFGSVHRAMCKQTGMQRAIKSIRVDPVKGTANFELEISVAKQLDHPNIARLYETFRDQGNIYLVMELCTGGELFDMITNSDGFDELQAATFVKQILAGICYLHGRRIVHRDVKPENFLLHNSAAGAALKMVDFGLARRFEPGKTMSTRAGTAYYVAPQVLQGAYDEKCDVWSAGVIAYILLCGYPPFSGDTDGEIFQKVRSACFAFPSPEWDHITREAKGVVVQMLKLEPARRPSAESLLARTWLQANGSPKSPLVGSNFIARLQDFQAHTKLKKVALTAVAQQLPDEDTEVLQELFRSLDKNGDGVLSIHEVKEGLLSEGVRIPPALEEILQSVDSDGSGTLDYSEFVAALIDQDVYGQRDICKAAFRTFDLDGDGKITQDELDKVLSGTSPANGIKSMIMEADCDGDGCLDFEEFYSILSPKSKSQQMGRSRVLLGREGHTAAVSFGTSPSAAHGESA